MEANEERVRSQRNSERGNHSNLWVRASGENQMCFATAYSLNDFQDFTPLTGSLPDGIVLCDSGIVAGVDHIEQVLFQASDYWQRKGKIARKKSIDLLMRITCQRQINDAIVLSKISKTRSVVIFGIVKSPPIAENTLHLLESQYPLAKRNDDLIELDKEKIKSLKELQHLPKSLSGDQLRVALKEKSALLVFSH
jgi:tRNA threonylcarbamoyladenosine modification (KEOPS) complex Cgi121 subunit